MIIYSNSYIFDEISKKRKTQILHNLGYAVAKWYVSITYININVISLLEIETSILPPFSQRSKPPMIFKY